MSAERSGLRESREEAAAEVAPELSYLPGWGDGRMTGYTWLLTLYDFRVLGDYGGVKLVFGVEDLWYVG